MEWISVKDKMPDLNKWVILYTINRNTQPQGNGLYSAQYIIGPSSPKPYFSVCSDEYNDQHEEITHWIYEKDFPFPDKDK